MERSPTERREQKRGCSTRNVRSNQTPGRTQIVHAESKQNRVSLSSQILQFQAPEGLATLPEGFIGPIFKCHRHPQTRNRAACRKIALHQARATKACTQNSGAALPRNLGSHLPTKDRIAEFLGYKDTEAISSEWHLIH